MPMDRTSKLLSFLDQSPTPYHAIDNIKKSLLSKSFRELSEKSCPWLLELGSSYYITRNDSAMIAFSLPQYLVYFHSLPFFHSFIPYLFIYFC